MTFIDRFSIANSTNAAGDNQSTERQPILLVVEDDETTSTVLQPICEFLDIALERVPSEIDLSGILREFRPMGVVTALDCRGQDGCNVMITVADYDRTLPMLLLIGDEPYLAGAADAVEEVWQLEAVTKAWGFPGVGEVVDFILRAGRKGRCSRMMRV